MLTIPGLGWVHALDPVAFSIGDFWQVKWYGLSYLLGFICAFGIFRLLARRGQTSLTFDQTTDFVVNVAFGTIIGGRLGYLIFYSPETIVTFSSAFPFWEGFAIWKGGLASHGGIIGILVAAGLFARKHKLSWLHLADLCSLTAPLGVTFGRIANFINGELYGRPATSGDLSWAVRFPSEVWSWSSAKLETLAPAASLIGIDHTHWSRLIQLGAVDRALHRFSNACAAGQMELCRAVGTVLTPRYASQLIEALLEGLLLFLVLAFAAWRRPRTGVLTALTFLLYPIGRFIGEHYREPDAQIGYQLLGLTRGQWLSVAMFVISGVVTWVVISSGRAKKTRPEISPLSAPRSRS